MADRNSVVIGHSGALIVSRGQTGPGERGGESVWSLRVRLVNEGLVAETCVSLGPEGVEQSLADFFDELAGSWRGWAGVKAWVGMEGGMTLSCSHDGLGHVQVSVTLRQLSRAGWRVESDAVVDAGQLDGLVRELRELLSTQTE
jgi:Family of unknown function (DUF6228)